eukprot:TRINITY_DN236_c0_g1_i1.p1 TRINITY_DN236_c0_g1~~TRINITY_DN236_c0_g1_i1.p1  ORF type:complete len:145 (-),score=18.42 TRINITY_DN236_c0_g1_i1:716-1150(-)
MAAAMAAQMGSKCLGASVGFSAVLKGKVVGSNRGELAGLSPAFSRLSVADSRSLNVASPSVVCPVAMSRRCTLTGKKANNGYKVSFSNKKSKKLQQPNLQYKRLWWEKGNRFVRLRLCTKALKTVDLKGLDAMANAAGIDLNKF